MPGSYDPELNLVYWGTGVTAPLPEKLREARARPISSTRIPRSPSIRTPASWCWYFQHLPRDNWDLDHTFERMIVRTEVSPSAEDVPWINPKVRPGETRKIITGIPGKTGIIWTLDAQTGEFLWARPTVYQNIMTGINVETGRPIINEDSTPQSVDKPFVRVPVHAWRQEPAVRGL